MMLLTPKTVHHARSLVTHVEVPPKIILLTLDGCCDNFFCVVDSCKFWFDLSCLLPFFCTFWLLIFGHSLKWMTIFFDFLLFGFARADFLLVRIERLQFLLVSFGFLASN
ncbi:hypothetical protein Ancab_032036 [Ancistrocladus abbreviatus]